jgi:CRP-like cAMP-binding protein
MTASPDIADVLRSTSLLSAAQPSTVATLAVAARIRVLKKDDVLFLEGDRPLAVFAVASGMLRVFTTTFDGAEPTFTLLPPGTLVGELGVLDEVERSASVSALRAATVIEIPARAFRTAYDADPAIARRLVELLSARLRALSDGLADLAHLDLGGRLAKYLAAELDRAGSDRFRLGVTQAELGQMLGGARQSVNQALQTLERSGLVRLDGRNVHVLDPRGLHRRGMAPAERVL